MNAFLARLTLLIALPLTAHGQSADTPAAEPAALGMRLQILATCATRDAQGRCLPIQQRDTPERPAPDQVKALTPAATAAGQPFVTTAF